MEGCAIILLILAVAALVALAVALKLLFWCLSGLLRAVGLMAPVREKASVLKGPARHKQQWRNDFAAFKSGRDFASAALLQYAADALLAGMDSAAVSAALEAKGWAPGEVKKGLADLSAFLSGHPLLAVKKAG